MNVESLRIALRQPEALALLTERQRKVYDLYRVDPNVSAIARELGVSRQAVMKSLRLASKKFEDFAREIAG